MTVAPRRDARPAHRRPHRWSRTIRLAIVAAVLSLIAGFPAASASPGDRVPVLRLEGRGHGHGVGLSQWGARSMAAQGADAATILSTYYPGTANGSASGEVIVAIASGGRALVSLPQGGELRSARGGAQAAGFPIGLAPGEVVAIHHDGSGYRVERGGVRALTAAQAQPFQADDCVLLCPPPPTEPEPAPDPEPAPEPQPDDCVVCGPPSTEPPSQPAPDEPAPGEPAPAPTPPPGDQPPPASPDAPRSPTPIWAVPAGGGTVHSVDRGRTYRGLLEITGGPGQVRVRNHVDIEDYLRGMAEVPSTWPAAAVQAQAVAARTYALRAMAGAGEICDSESCQVYAGVAREAPGQDAAVAATRGWVLTHGGGLAATFYSASAGGHTANVQEGFGSGYDVPYLQARPEPTDDIRPWSLDVSLQDVGARLGYPGRVTGVRIDATGPSGRPIAMSLQGDAGDRSVDPQTFRRRLGLRSTLFTAVADVADQAPPPPPPPVEQDQLLTAADPTTTIRAPRSGTEELAAPRTLPVADAPAAARIGRAAVVLLALALAGWLWVSRLGGLGRAIVADGLGRAPLGAAPIGWRDQLAATMAPWRNRAP